MTIIFFKLMEELSFRQLKKRRIELKNELKKTEKIIEKREKFMPTQNDCIEVALILNKLGLVFPINSIIVKQYSKRNFARKCVVCEGPCSRKTECCYKCSHYPPKERPMIAFYRFYEKNRWDMHRQHPDLNEIEIEYKLDEYWNNELLNSEERHKYEEIERKERELYEKRLDYHEKKDNYF